MTAPNRNALWGSIIVDELAKSGVQSVLIAPGSRSTPIAVAFAESEEIETDTHLDERSAGFFAVGRGKRSPRPSAVLTTSGTAAANLHPAVIEAYHSRTPLIVLTADRPPELHDSGANQTIDQTSLYGSAVRYARTLPEPRPEARTLRSLRTTVSRAVSIASGTPNGPVHLNIPFKKPLEPVEVAGDVPADLDQAAPLGVDGRDGPFVSFDSQTARPGPSRIETLRSSIESASRGLVVAGPMNHDTEAARAIGRLSDATGFPLLADPLSGVRFGEYAAEAPVVGGYDGYLGTEAISDWPDPDLVLRFGASPTSKVLRHYLRDRADRQVLVDEAGEWREAEFTATEQVNASPAPVADRLASRVEGTGSGAGQSDWADRFVEADRTHWQVVSELVETAEDTIQCEGEILYTVTQSLPDPTTLFVSNSMPVRDLDRFGRPRTDTLTVLGNRGASGIDGITSTGLGAGSVTDDPLVIVTGDLAYFHDTNGLLALERFDLDATIVLINNDGGGIFHMLPIEDFDPPFERHFKTPHGIDFASTASMHELEFARFETLADLERAVESSVGTAGTQVLEVPTDAERSHRRREQIATEVGNRLEELYGN
ncbi:MAG: 2-succinyl-5-enolpyruvyl-6-hydroxy-3-cyclohexene-1-carboxylic-acid synthase [Halodesulfurarchaeum sp.]